MRKKWLSFLLVLCFLVTAGSAFGAVPVVPEALNGTTWYLAGFQYNATVSDDGTRNNETASVVWAEQLNSTYIGPIAGMASGLNGTASIWNNRIGLAGQNSTFFNASENNAGVANNWRVSDYYIDNVNELYSINAEEGSIFFAANPSHTLMAGYANGSIAAPQDALVDLLNYNNATNGTGMYLMVQNTTITSASDVAGTWYIYGLVGNATQSATSVNLPNVYGVAGKLVLNTGKTGTVSFARNNGTADGEFLNATGVAVKWDNNTMFTVEVNATGYGNLFTGALSSDKNYMVGYNATQSGTGIDNSTALYIALKGASTFTAADFKSAAFNQVGYYNAPLGGQLQMNGTLGVIHTDADGVVTKGNSTSMFARSSNAPLVETVDLADATPVIGTTTAAGITHGTFTTRGFTFVGRKKGDVMAGLIVNSANDVVGLEVMTKVAAGTSAPAAPAGADLTSMQNDIGTTGDSAVNAGNNANLGGLDPGAETLSLDTKVLRFVNATDAEKAATFGLTGTQFIDNTFPTLIFSANGITANDFVALTFDMDGNDANVRNLPVPTKFYVNATSSYANGTNAVNTKRALTYRNTGSAVTDGCWWITTSGANPFNALSYANDKLALGSTYTAYVVIRDNGLFDLHPSLGTVVDPIPFVGGAAPGGGAAAGGGDDDDDGCVFNPAASMSLEFLLLLLAPAAYLIRRRKK